MLHKSQLNLTGLVHAMRSNGPLHQVEEMDEVLAFIYTGPCKPTKADFKLTPMLVRCLKVSKALHWLKLNHADYYDCEISEKNLASYPEDGPPVVVDYYPSS